MKKRLTLKRETIAELTRDDLTTVVGGAESAQVIFTCPVVRCAKELTVVGCDLTYNTCG